MQTQRLNDRELIHLYVGGQEQAFEELLFRYKNKVFTTIQLMVKDNSVAEDIFQETFIKIIDTLRTGKYTEEGKFLPWALRISYNLCIDHFRRTKRSPAMSTLGDYSVFENIRFTADNAETDIIKRQVYARLRQMIDQLPPEQREVVILRHYADLSFKEIAELTCVSINTALGRMRYALNNIRKMMLERQDLQIR